MNSQPLIAYLDCFSGISGNMVLGALLDAGLPLATLKGQLDLLGLADFKLLVETRKQGSVQGTHVSVDADEEQPRRRWPDIEEIIDASSLSAPVKQTARRIFLLLAEAEAGVHGVTVDKVHFHEVGGVDALVDIVGAAVGFDHFGITGVVCSPLPMPRGWVRCDHGALPLPAPAVCEILKNVPTYGVDLDQELVTPTGAAIARAMSRDFGPLPAMTVREVGYGAGTRELGNGHPNLFRLILGESHQPEESQLVEVIETNLDDWSPEGFPYLCDMLFSLGALDVSLTPMQVKKGRPGFLLRVIADPARAFPLKQCLFSETTTIGLRSRREERWTLPRENGFVNTPWGKVGVKRVATPGGPVLYPEYEDCRRVAERYKVPLKKIHALIAGREVTDFFTERKDG